MAEFNLHVRADTGALGVDSLEAYLREYVDDRDGATVSDGEDAPGTEPDTLEAVIEIENVDAFGELYAELHDEAVVDVGPWGPTAERFALPVQHYALQQISTPDAYEFHAIDDRVTLVIADTQQGIEQLRQEVPPAALG